MTQPTTDYYVLHSGGLDSTTALTLAAQRPNARGVYSIGVNYGQRHRRELDAAEETAAIIGARRLTLDLTGYGASVTSALTDPAIDVPEGDYDADNMAATVVPGRNAVMLAAVSGMAASISGDHPATIVIGVHGGDHHIYADCRPDFISAQAHALNLACGVDVWAPFLDRTKAQITALGSAIGAPLSHTWSCYQGGEKHCGRCGTCRERRESFIIAGVPDPTEYAA